LAKGRTKKGQANEKVNRKRENNTMVLSVVVFMGFSKETKPRVQRLRRVM
jgi:hypothetical protein